MTVSENIVLKGKNETKAAFNELEKDARKAAGAVSKESQTAKTGLQALDSSLTKLVTGGALLALGVQAVQFGKQAVAAYEDSARAQAQMEAVLRSTSGAAGMTTGEINDLSSAVSKLTGIDDDLLTRNQAILLTFTSISEDVFPDTLQAAVDLSAALNQDLQGSIIQVGKALNDPIQGLTALRRVGVSFNDEQEKTIKGLAESGKLLEAQKMILGELNKEFGGSAKALHEAGTGADSLRVAWGNLLEQEGKRMAPMVREVNTALAEYIDLQTLAIVVQEGLKDARNKGVITEEEYFYWISQGRSGMQDAGAVQDWLRQKTEEYNRVQTINIEQMRGQGPALAGAVESVEELGEAYHYAGGRMVGFNRQQAESAIQLMEMKSNWETLLGVLDRQVESPIANFIKDLEWLQAGGGQINVAFEQIKAGVEQGTISPEEAKPMLEGLYIAALDVKEEIGQVNIWEAAKQGADEMGIKAGEVKAMIEGTEGISGALAKVGEIETKLGIDAQALTDAIGYADTLKARQEEIESRKVKPDVDTSGLQGGINKANELDTALGRIQGKKIDIYIEYHTTGNPPGGQHGLHMIVPPGFPNDSFPVMASSGESVDISPGAAPSIGAAPGSGAGQLVDRSVTIENFIVAPLPGMGATEYVEMTMQRLAELQSRAEGASMIYAR